MFADLEKPRIFKGRFSKGLRTVRAAEKRTIDGIHAEALEAVDVRTVWTDVQILDNSFRQVVQGGKLV